MPDITSIILVNACDVLSDAEVAASVPAFQYYDDTILRPAWDLAPCSYSFMPWAQFEKVYRATSGELAWPQGTVAPLFFNKNSSDPGALGWHEDDLNSIFGRVFVGDDLKYGVSPWVDASHEACETRVDPLTNRTVMLENGDRALVEVGDPVEDDLFKITMPGFEKYPMSDTVNPRYFGLTNPSGLTGYDYGGHLTAPCPALLSGGYQSLLKKGATDWTQLTADLTPKMAWRIMSSRRADRLRRLAGGALAENGKTS